MDWRRWFRHTFATRGPLRRAFPAAALDRIEAAVDAAEQQHSGEIRVAIEAALEPGDIARGRTPRERALEVFAALGVWDTGANNGVLVYVLLADHDVEIIADRGFNGRVGAEQWVAICADLRREFQAGRHEAGLIAAVDTIGRLIAVHFPRTAGQRDTDELPDRPALL